MSTEQDKISRIKDHKAKIESENTLIQQRINDFQDESKKSLGSFSSTLDQSKNSVLSDINSVMSSIEKLATELNEYKNKTLVSEKDALGSRLNDLLGQVNSGIQKLQNSIVDLSSKQEEDVSGIYSQMAGKVNTGLSDIYSSQRDQITKFENEISSQLERVNRDIVSTVEGESANQREMTESIASSFLKSLEDFRSRIRDLSDTKETNVDAIFSGTVSESIGRLEMAKEDLLASIDGVMNQLEDSLAKQKTDNEEMQKAIQEGISKTKSDVKDRIENQRLELVEEWNTIDQEQKSTLASIKETTGGSFQSALETNESFQAKLLTELEQQLKVSLYSEIDNITLSFTKFQDSIINQIDSLISRLTSARDEMKGSLEGLLVSNLNKIGDIGKQLEDQLSSISSQVSDEYKKSRESTYSNLMNAVEDRFNAINTSLDQYKETTSTKLEKTSTDLDVSLMNFFDTTQTTVSDTVDKNNVTLDQLGTSVNESFRTLQSGQEKNIETTLTDIRNTLRMKQSELITAISSISPAAEDHIESNREFAEEKKAEVTRTSSTAFEDLRKQVTNIEQDGLSAIQSIVQNTHHQLDQNVKDSEQRTKELIEGLEDEHKSSIARYRSNATQELNRNTEMLDEYRNTLQEKFTSFFDNQQQSLDSFIDVNRSRREAVDDQRRNLDIKFEELGNTIDTATETLSTNINTNTGNVTTSVKNILRDVDDIIKTMK